MQQIAIGFDNSLMQFLHVLATDNKSEKLCMSGSSKFCQSFDVFFYFVF